MPLTFFKALADETRLSIVVLLHQEVELCVCELTSAMQLSQPKISRHLALLRDTGIIQSRRQGKWIHYSLNHTLPDWQQASIAGAANQLSDKLLAITSQLNQSGNKIERQEICC